MESLALLWRYRTAIVITLAGLVIGGLYLALEMQGRSLDAAEARAESAETRAHVAEEAARANAEAVRRLARLHEEQLAAIARDAQEARERAERTAFAVETLRRDPTHSSAAAPVLGRAVERLRKRRAGGEDRAPSPAGLPAAADPTPAPAAGGGSADAGHGG